MPVEVNNSAHNLTIESYISVEVKGKLGAMDSKCVIIKNLLMLSVRISRYAGMHTGSLESTKDA